MKLHLPTKLRSAVFCALPTALSLATSYSSGAIVTGFLVYALSVTPAQGVTEEQTIFLNDIQGNSTERHLFSDAEAVVAKPIIPMLSSEAHSDYPHGNITYTSQQKGSQELSGYETVGFRDISSPYGGAIYNDATFRQSNNGCVTFCENSASYYGGAIYNDATFRQSDNEFVTFCENSASDYGGAICNLGGTFTQSRNSGVAFSGNSASHYGGAIYNVATFRQSNNEFVTFCENSASYYGGAICNLGGTFTQSRNNGVAFSGNSASYSGGAIFNHDTFTLIDNGNVTFIGNSAEGYSNESGGAVHNSGSFTLSGNGKMIFSGNNASAFSTAYGGAVHNDGFFTLSGDGEVIFCGNNVSASSIATGGAIYNSGSFTLIGNENVLFEKNFEKSNDSYCLRSIYSEKKYSYGVLNLSASSSKSVLFRDSVYAEGGVNLNQDGLGDIIFSGASTEADLREVKEGVDGTPEEIMNSRTSDFATNAKLHGGRLIVENSAILRGKGITVTEEANATICLNNGTLDERWYVILISSGSGLELSGTNSLIAGSVQMEDGANLRFVMGDGDGTDWGAQLVTGQLNVQVSGDLFHEHRLLILHNASQYDTSLWTSDAITVRGTTFDSLNWNEGVLTYTPHVIETEEDGDLDDRLPDNGNAIIDGKGHSLTVKNEVQLVQMALKDGTVKLEGENNGIVSVMLTEDGELVLTAGAGLTTGDIISMVASGKGELVISGDITLDDKGMKGKDGNLATVSHADMKVLGDASISNVRVEDSTIDLLEGSTVNFTNVVLAATARITDAPATANLNDVYAELVLGVNAEQTGCGELSCGSVLTQTGNTGEALTLADDASVLLLEATTFDSVLLTGTTLMLDLSGLSDEAYNGAAFIGISFTSGKAYATFDNTLEVLLTMDGITYTPGYTLGGDATTVYFRGGNAPVVPEPATATLSLLALATLAARRRRLLPKVY